MKTNIGIPLNDYILLEEQNFPEATGKFTLLLTYIQEAVKAINSKIRKSGLVNILGSAGKSNVYGEEVQKLDELSNSVLINACANSQQVYAVASEEVEDIVYTKSKNAPYIVYFDPLDGSSNIDVNVSVGTIFSIYRRSGTSKNIFQESSFQVASGYVIYGSSTMLVYSCGKGVHGFTYDPSVGSFLLSHNAITIPKKGSVYSINEAYYHSYSKFVQNYLNNLKKQKNKLRYVGSLVADIHRTLIKGGIFLYPSDKHHKNGKLRKLFEINPLGKIIIDAGGLAVDDSGRDILKDTPSFLHEKGSFIAGSRDNVQEFITNIS